MAGRVQGMRCVLQNRTLALALLMCAGCGGGSDRSPAGSEGRAVPCGAAPTTEYQGRNNGGIIDGSELGTRTAAPDELRRSVQMQPDVPHPSFEVGPALVTRDDPSSETALLIVAVKNVGSVADCFIALEPMQWQSASGLLGEPEVAFVTGSLGVLEAGSVFYTSTCLAPGESGFATEIRLGGLGGPNYYSELASISYTLTTIGDTPRDPEPRLVPRAYDVNSRGSLSVTLENTGSCSAVVTSSSFSSYVMLDEDSTPVMWGFLDHGAGEIGVGATATAVHKSPLRFAGSARRVQFFFDFEEKFELASLSQSEDAAIDEVSRAASRFALGRERQERALRGIRDPVVGRKTTMDQNRVVAPR
jgi:hypothetical protein